ncbi:hypothetical protein KPL76_11760 [Subtercola sp. PAMC28395]|uniref:hypothetical protein n=1 Tax=Subtercola sp. PAMC28395 TaxID=2846775 RepID=UPI001C0C90D5|nr:hypothetical protein [Subtercola sp. PAMC28395]QWT23389.1 hypothetical protein KPL76_11760 [Subtercola sp. PAMC28395]
MTAAVAVTVLLLASVVLTACASTSAPDAPNHSTSKPGATGTAPAPVAPTPGTTSGTSTANASPSSSAKPAPSPSSAGSSSEPSGGLQSGLPSAGTYPWHTNIVSTTFWVGEIFDPTAPDGSQVLSTYDSKWYASYGGCDGVIVSGVCQTETRTAARGYLPTSMTPKENPFYLDLPFDDINNASALTQRASVIPWAHEPGYASHLADPNFSLMKNRWVELQRGSRTCYAQIEDAGPGQYDDSAYVFGSNDARPLNSKFGGAGMDVSPAVNGCLAFTELNGDTDTVSWRFVDDSSVPTGPWTTRITTSGVQ